MDLIENGGDEVKRVFKNLRFVVLDEADRLLHQQFEEQLQLIKAILPKNKQTLFFSATIADHNVMKNLLKDFSEKAEEVMMG